MKAQRGEQRETIIYSTGRHWITLGPALVLLAIAGAVEAWGTSGLFEQIGWDDLAEQATASLGVDLDRAIIVLSLALGALALGSGLLRLFGPRLQVTATGVRWLQRGQAVSAGFGSFDGVQVEQGLLGRVLGYGTINVVGRNAIGRRRPIKRPDAFRKAFNDQMSKWLCRDIAADPRKRSATA